MKEIEKVLNQNEKIFWEGVPSFWPFILTGSIFTTIFGVFWMMFLIPFMFAMGPFVIFVPHFWIGIILVFGVPVYQVLVYKHTYYAITDKRVIFQKGWIGRDFQMIDFDQITNAEVRVDLFDKIFGKGNTGSVLISSAGTFVHTKNGLASKPYAIRNVVNPYDIFKMLKQVSHDVKTDIEYPNKLRPSENPGYKTDYKIDNK